MNDHDFAQSTDNQASIVTLDAVLRTDLPAFVRKVFGTVSSGDRYAANWHIEAICHVSEKVRHGEIKRLIITIPPRHLKSICTSVALPAWILGHDPTRKIICVSYAQELSAKHGNDCRAVMSSEWYQRLFPGTKIDPTKNNEAEFITTERGIRLSTSIGGVLTGRGGNLIIIDDPMKPADAMSESARANLIEWYGGTLISRLNDKENDAIIVVMQRLHEDDLVGHLLQEQGWTHLNLPAIAELEQHIEIGPGQFHARKPGDLLHPERESWVTLDNLKRTMGSAAFAAQYQQSPVPPGGGMIEWGWFPWYEPDHWYGPKYEAEICAGKRWNKFERIVISWDTAMKASERSDYSVGTVWGVWDQLYYLIDVIRARLEFPALLRKVVDVYEQWQCAADRRAEIVVEDGGSGTALVQYLREYDIRAVAMKADADKVMRLSAQSAKIEAGQVRLPRGAKWLDEFRNEVLAFPQGKHDDQVDSMSQALKYMSVARGLVLVDSQGDVYANGRWR
jgi:predicted phage terminase large subunit-like protein